MKRIFTLVLCAVLLCAAIPASASAATDINFVTAGTSGTFYAISVEVAKLWNERTLRGCVRWRRPPAAVSTT